MFQEIRHKKGELQVVSEIYGSFNVTVKIWSKNHFEIQQEG